jgi:hypothetical protein
MNLEWTWNPIHASKIPDGIRVVLKMADSNDNISYALAISEGGQLRYTACEDEAGRLPVYWMALPK